MISRIFVLFLLSLSQLPEGVASVDQIVLIKEITRSGKTIHINRGRLSDIADGDFGVFVQKLEKPGSGFIYRPIAKVRLLKLFRRESIWVAYNLLVPHVLTKGKKFILLSETALLKGRSTLKIKRTGVVVNKNLNKEVRDFLLEGDNLAQKNKDLTLSGRPHKKEKHQNEDFDLIDISKWEAKLGDNKLFVSGIYRSPYAEEFSDRFRVRTFEKMTMAFFKKYNDPSFDYESFYEGQERDSSGYIPNKSLSVNYKDNYDQDVVNEEKKQKELYKKLKEKGEAWSKDYSDEQLSSLLNKMSIVREKQRRKGLVAHKFNVQAFLGGGLNFVNNENPADKVTTEQSKFDFEVGVEGYFVDALESFQVLTLEFSARRAQDSFVGKDLNVKSSELSLATHLNWYPFRQPSAINANIFYIGGLMRFGISTLINVTFSETGNYQLSSFPGIRGGWKYNFTSSYGIRLALASENIKVERVKRSDDNGVLPDRSNYIEGKMSVSLSKIF